MEVKRTYVKPIVVSMNTSFATGLTCTGNNGDAQNAVGACGTPGSSPVKGYCDGHGDSARIPTFTLAGTRQASSFTWRRSGCASRVC